MTDDSASCPRAPVEFLPRPALDPGWISALDALMADAVAYKYLAGPLSEGQLDELIQIPERKPQKN